MGESESDKLVDRARAGSRGAINDLIKAYERKVYTLCLRLTAEPNDAQDLAQEVFLRVFQSLHTFRGGSSFDTWLHRVTLNLWKDELRRRNRYRGTVSLDAPIPADDDDSDSVHRQVLGGLTDPEASLENKILADTVWAALSRLSDEHRTILVLREMEDYSYEGLAGYLGCSIGTVKSRLNRARRSFKEALASMGYGGATGESASE